MMIIKYLGWGILLLGFYVAVVERTLNNDTNSALFIGSLMLCLVPIKPEV